jgi:hypothetical protein
MSCTQRDKFYYKFLVLDILPTGFFSLEQLATLILPMITQLPILTFDILRGPSCFYTKCYMSNVLRHVEFVICNYYPSKWLKVFWENDGPGEDEEVDAPVHVEIHTWTGAMKDDNVLIFRLHEISQTNTSCPYDGPISLNLGALAPLYALILLLHIQ